MKLSFMMVLITLIHPLLARDTQSQKDTRLALSTLSDSQIQHITPSQLISTLSQGTLIVFYGAIWCKFTQKFNPHYLAVQNRITPLISGVNFRMRKVECGDEAFCTDELGLVGFPTVVLYRMGVKIEEYLEADEEEPFYEYVKQVVDNMKVIVKHNATALAGVNVNTENIDAATKMDGGVWWSYVVVSVVGAFGVLIGYRLVRMFRSGRVDQQSYEKV